MSNPFTSQPGQLTLAAPHKKPGKWARDFKKNRLLYFMIIPVVLYYILFHYLPIYGITIAFQDFKPRLGFFNSPWVGFENFLQFFNSIFFGRLLRNTMLLSFYGLLFGFPVPILFAILLNEVRSLKFKKTIQTITYLPQFISTVIIASLIVLFTNSDGFVTAIVGSITGNPASLISNPDSFRAIYTISGIWQGFGWGSIVYLASISGISAELYEAATIDGANKFQRILHVTIPGMLPTIVIMFIMAIGGFMSVGWEKAFLLQVPETYETSDIISTYVYRKGFIDMDYSFSAAVDLFNSVINVILLTLANFLSRKYSETSLW